MKNRAHYENLRDQLVACKIAHYLKGGDCQSENYNPFDKKNFDEFLQNMPEDLIEKLRVGAEKTSLCGDPGVRWLLAEDFSNGVVRYWRGLATAVAEKETPSVEQMIVEGV